MNIQQALHQAIETFCRSKVSRSAASSKADFAIDAEILLLHCLQKNRAFLRTHPDRELSDEEEIAFRSLVAKRAENYPLAYLLGQQAFWTLELLVNEHVLIPRPETEGLVEWILEHFKTNMGNLSILDAGTGSGAIALSLASEKPHWRISACDISSDALAVARYNASKYQINNVEFFESDWLKNIPHAQFDCIVSNPPYVESKAFQFETESIAFEPRIALSSGDDGLNAIRTLCIQAFDYLKPSHPLLVEHGSTQAGAVRKIFEQHAYYDVQCQKDHAGHERFTVGLRSP